MGTLHEDQYTLLTIPCSVLLGMRNFPDKLCRRNQNTFYFQKPFFFENRSFYEIMWENIQSRICHTQKYGTSLLHATYPRLQNHIQNKYAIRLIFTATVVAHPRLNSAFYIHSLSCKLISHFLSGKVNKQQTLEYFKFFHYVQFQINFIILVEVIPLCLKYTNMNTNLQVFSPAQLIML